MAGHGEYERDFAEQMSGISFDIPVEEWPTVRMDGQTVGINHFYGLDLREKLQAIYDRTLVDHVHDDVSLDPQAHDRADTAMNAFLFQKDSPIVVLERVAVKGLGLMLKTHGNKAVAEPYLLSRAQVLFGRLVSCSYGEYPWQEQEELEIESERGHIGEFEYHYGLKIALDQVIVCQDDQEGTVIETAKYAAVPIETSSLQIHKTALLE